MTNDTFLDQSYEDSLNRAAEDPNEDPNEDLNDGLDDLLLNDDDDDDADDADDDWEGEHLGSYAPRSRNAPPYSGYGPYHGPYNSTYPGYAKPEPPITKELLKALLASHAREIALLKKMNKDLTSQI